MVSGVHGFGNDHHTVTPRSGNARARKNYPTGKFRGARGKSRESSARPYRKVVDTACIRGRESPVNPGGGVAQASPA